jgi:site-specific DNA recombinase
MERTNKVGTQRFVEDLQVVLAKAYTNKQSETVKEKMFERVADGYAVTRPPVGYEKTSTKGLYVPTRYGQSMGFVLEAVAYGHLSLTSAIGILQLSLEALTGKEVSNTSVLKIIGNPYYAGLLYYQGERYTGKHIPLITVEQHEAIMGILQDSDSNTTARRIHCPICSEL